MCVVEDHRGGIVASCSTPPKNGMEISAKCSGNLHICPAVGKINSAHMLNFIADLFDTSVGADLTIMEESEELVESLEEQDRKYRILSRIISVTLADCHADCRRNLYHYPLIGVVDRLPNVVRIILNGNGPGRTYRRALLPQNPLCRCSER